MKVIYIAGKYRDPRGEYYVLENIRAAEKAAIFVWQNGGVALCPHKNTAMFGGAAPDDVWLDGDLELMIRCDAVWAIGIWQESKGAVEEIQIARHRGMRVFFDKDEVCKYLHR